MISDALVPVLLGYNNECPRVSGLQMYSVALGWNLQWQGVMLAVPLGAHATGFQKICWQFERKAGE